MKKYEPPYVKMIALFRKKVVLKSKYEQIEGIIPPETINGKTIFVVSTAIWDYNPNFPQDKKHSIVERHLEISESGIEETTMIGERRFFWGWDQVRTFSVNDEEWFGIEAPNYWKQDAPIENFVWNSPHAYVIEDTVKEIVQRLAAKSQNAAPANKKPDDVGSQTQNKKEDVGSPTVNKRQENLSSPSVNRGQDDWTTSASPSVNRKQEEITKVPSPSQSKKQEDWKKTSTSNLNKKQEMDLINFDDCQVVSSPFIDMHLIQPVKMVHPFENSTK
jgi:hypothetical protein